MNCKMILGCLALAAGASAQAAGPVKIGFIATLSTPAGYIGEDERDAFNLAIQQGGGKLGGVPVELVIGTTGSSPPTPSRPPTGCCNRASGSTPA